MKEKRNIYKNLSLKSRLILAFIFISIIPVMVFIWLYYINITNIIRDNASETAISKVNHTGVSLDVWLGSYEDVLFQIYTNDEIVDMLDTINKKEEDITMVSGQLRRTLRGLFYAKEYIKSITVITESKDVVFYDLLTGSTTKNSWLDNLGMEQDELYRIISDDNATHVISTEYAGIYASEPYYLFHIGHRIIDYKNLEKQLGIVIVSIDEKLLREICSYEEPSNEFTFMVDRGGCITSYPSQDHLGEKVIEWVEDSGQRNQQYIEFIKKQNIVEGENISVNSIYKEEFGCDIINVSNQSEMMNLLSRQKNITMMFAAASMLLLIIIIITLTHSLTASLQMLVKTMKRAGGGELSVRVGLNDKMLPEVETISAQFDQMLDKVELSMEREKEAVEKQKNAEIEALEAQMNPHFLYNTLDTINWMAIDNEEYEISNSITSLATILRYGIDKSNSIVTLRKECEWLKQYLFLQQTRLKNKFEYEIHVEPEVLEWKIHKLLLQPFVENAIIHGFEGRSGTKRLEVIIHSDGGILDIEIMDNGKGMDPVIAEKMNQGIFPKSPEKNHIGMENAFTRMDMYYQGEANVWIESKIGSYTKIHIRVPKRVD